MKIGVLGAGLMGKEAARDLAESEKVKAVGLADIDLERAKAQCLQIGSDKVSPHQVDANNPEELENFMKNYDVIINALFYTFNEKVVDAAIKTGVHSVDLGGHIGHITDHILTKTEEAKAANVTIIPDLGVAPGMINILSGYGASKLDQTRSIKLYVGGIPAQPEPPLGYNHVFSLEGLFDHYTDPATILRNGKKVEVPSLSEVETLYFERFGPLEAFHTSGGTSTLIHSFPDLDTLEYKTIRYPGHAEKFKLLVDLNLTRKDYFVDVNGVKVNPREVFLKTLAPIVELKDKDDVVLLRVEVSGTSGGKERTITYEMATFKDRTKNVTAMARSTAFTISVVAQMIASGLITKRGVYPPEQIVPGDVYIEEMAKRGVIINEKITDKVREND